MVAEGGVPAAAADDPAPLFAFAVAVDPAGGADGASLAAARL